LILPKSNPSSSGFGIAFAGTEAAFGSVVRTATAAPHFGHFTLPAAGACRSFNAVEHFGHFTVNMTTIPDTDVALWITANYCGITFRFKTMPLGVTSRSLENKS
jgi:hypothetical protein